MGDSLSGQQVGLFGSPKDIYAWPVVQLGVDATGKGVPVLVSPEGGIVVTPQGAAHGAVTVIPTAGQTAGTSTVAARPTRAGALIQNYSTSPEALWFGYSSGVSATTGVQLLAGQSCPISNVGALFFFSVSGTATGVVIEDYS